MFNRILKRFRRREEAPKRTLYSDIAFKPNKSKIERNSYVHLREASKGLKKSTGNSSMQKVKESIWVTISHRILRRRLLYIVALVFLIGLLAVLSQLSVFKIVNIVQKGDEIEPEIVNSLLYKNIFLVRNAQIEAQIKSQDALVKEVFVRKLLPDTLEIEVHKSRIAVILLTFSGIFEVDSTYKTLQSYGDPLDLSDIDQRLLSGTMSIEDPLIKETYLSKITDEEERKAVKWEEVPPENKQAVLRELHGQIVQKIKSYQEGLLQKVSDIKTATFPIVYFETYLPEENEEAYLEDRLRFYIEIAEALKVRNLKVVNTVWVTSFTMQIVLEDNTSLLFGIMNNRSAANQISDLDTVLYNNKFQPGRTHDFRTNSYTIL